LRFFGRHWLLWLLLIALLTYKGLRHIPPPEHGPYMTCNTCALSTPIAGEITTALVLREMPRMYAVLPWLGGFVGARFMVCNPSHCVRYAMTAERGFIGTGQAIRREPIPACPSASNAVVPATDEP
jgi:hypothetical protein